MLATSADFCRLVDKFLVRLIGPGEFKRVRHRRSPGLDAGDHVGAPDPVGLGQIGHGPARGMIRMRMIEADDLFAALPAFALDLDQFLGIDVIAIVGRVEARVAAPRRARDSLRSIVIKSPQQYATALVRISFLAVLAKGGVVGWGNF